MRKLHLDKVFVHMNLVCSYAFDVIVKNTLGMGTLNLFMSLSADNRCKQLDQHHPGENDGQMTMEYHGRPCFVILPPMVDHGLINTMANLGRPWSRTMIDDDRPWSKIMVDLG